MSVVIDMLLLFVGGIALMQAVSSPQAVTLAWLRLGGLISVSLLAVAGTITWKQGSAAELKLLALVVLPVWVQLIAVQRGARTLQRWGAAAAFVAVCAVVWINATPQGQAGAALADTWQVGLIATPLGAGLLGGYLMTMLLGHAYLTAGNEMTQGPFLRLVLALAVVLLLRGVGSVLLGLLPALRELDWEASTATWNGVMITSRFLVGLGVPAVFTYMVYDCVKRRANQSATGILYVAGVMIVIGEGVALMLNSSLPYTF